MSTPSPERLARRRAGQARKVRRRRIMASLALGLAAVAVVMLFALGGSFRRHTGNPPVSTGGRRAGLHVLVTESGQLPAAVQDAAAARDGSAGALLIGGLDSQEESVTDFLRFDGAGATRLGVLSTALHDACAAAVAGRVYVFGGGQLTSFSQILRIGSDGTAQQVGSLPTPASDVACTTLGGIVYIVGGYTGQEPLRTILAWRPGEAPRVAALLPKPLRYPAVGQSGGQVMIAGGTSGLEASRDVYLFDPLTARVRRVARLPHAVTHAAGASSARALLLIGGRGSDPNSQTRAILAISPKGAVSAAGALPRGLSDLASIPSGESVILAGGRDSSGRVQRAILTITLKR
jgi:hypothetical protein